MEREGLPHRHCGDQRAIRLQGPLSRLEDFQAAAEVFKLLADTSRLRIYWLLCHCEACVVNISALTGLSSPAVSHHLRMLKAGGLLASRREGKEVYYRAADTEQGRLLHLTIEKTMAIACPAWREEGAHGEG